MKFSYKFDLALAALWFTNAVLWAIHGKWLIVAPSAILAVYIGLFVAMSIHADRLGAELRELRQRQRMTGWLS